MSFDSFNVWMVVNFEWLGLVIFFIVFFECVVIVGIVFFGVVLLFGVVVIVGSGVFGFGEILLLVYVGGVLGDFSLYWIGCCFYQNICCLFGLCSYLQWIIVVEVYFECYGIVSLLVGCFIGVL